MKEIGIEKNIQILKSITRSNLACDFNQQTEILNAIEVILGNLDALCDIQKTADKIIEKQNKKNKQLKKQIENLEKGIKRLKKKNEKLFEKSVEETVIATTKRLKEFYINKQIIKNKIEKLRNDIKNQNCRFPHIVEHKIDTLKELLEESEE